MNLPGAPRISPLTNWTEGQRRDLLAVWQDIARVLNTLNRTTGVTGAIASGTTVMHGLGAIPTVVLLTATDGVPVNVFVSGITMTTFTINYSGGGTHVFGWSAEV